MPEKTPPAVPDPAPSAPAADDQPEKLPDHKADLVALAINRGHASFDAWAMTVEELTELLKEA